MKMAGSRSSRVAPVNNWNPIGDANWRAEDGALVADKGKGGYVVSKQPGRADQVAEGADPPAVMA